MTQLATNAPAQQAVAKRSFNPIAPIGNANALKGLLESQRASIATMLPKHITPERLLKTLLVAVNRNPEILKCTQSSILETVNRAAELGLDLSGTLGEAYPVPFNNKIKFKDDAGREQEQWAMQLQLIIGYRGMEKLAWQSGEIESIDAEVVRAGDAFEFSKGTEVVVKWSPNLSGDRGDVVGAYACLKLKGGGKLARFLTKSDIEKIRAASKSKDGPAWRNWWDEMARKCALKRTLKDAPLSTEKFVKAMEHDETDFQMADALTSETDKPSLGNSALLRRLESRGIEKLPPSGIDVQIGEVDQAAPVPPAGQANPPATAASNDQDGQAGAGDGDSQIGGEESHEAPAIPDDEAKLGYDAWAEETLQAHTEGGGTKKQFEKGLSASLLRLRKMGKGWTTTNGERLAITKAVLDKTGDFAR